MKTQKEDGRLQDTERGPGQIHPSWPSPSPQSWTFSFHSYEKTNFRPLSPHGPLCHTLSPLLGSPNGITKWDSQTWEETEQRLPSCVDRLRALKGRIVWTEMSPSQDRNEDSKSLEELTPALKPRLGNIHRHHWLWQSCSARSSQRAVWACHLLGCFQPFPMGVTGGGRQCGRSLLSPSLMSGDSHPDTPSRQPSWYPSAGLGTVEEALDAESEKLGSSSKWISKVSSSVDEISPCSSSQRFSLK